jgi:5-methylcytosine-specific restriction endonuclease McrA
MNARIGNKDKLFPVKFDTDGLPFCRYCGKKLSNKHRRWCSGGKCTEEANIRCYPSWARSAVWEKDKGICAKCGLDTERLEHLYSRANGGTGYYYKSKPVWAKPKHKGMVDRLERLFPWIILRAFYRLSFWEAHHKHAVKDGGGFCGLDNYETLCYGCHVKTFKKNKSATD